VPQRNRLSLDRNGVKPELLVFSHGISFAILTTSFSNLLMGNIVRSYSRPLRTRIALLPSAVRRSGSLSGFVGLDGIGRAPRVCLTPFPQIFVYPAVVWNEPLHARAVTIRNISGSRGMRRLPHFGDVESKTR